MVIKIKNTLKGFRPGNDTIDISGRGVGMPMLEGLCVLCRQYEEKQLKGQQQRAQKRLEFSDLQSRLQNQLMFEKQRKLSGRA